MVPISAGYVRESPEDDDEDDEDEDELGLSAQHYRLASAGLVLARQVGGDALPDELPVGATTVGETDGRLAAAPMGVENTGIPVAEAPQVNDVKVVSSV